MKKEPNYAELKQERDLLLTLAETAQKRDATAQRTIRLLVLAGHVTEERVKQAQELAAL